MNKKNVRLKLRKIKTVTYEDLDKNEPPIEETHTLQRQNTQRNDHSLRTDDIKSSKSKRQMNEYRRTKTGLTDRRVDQTDLSDIESSDAIKIKIKGGLGSRSFTKRIEESAKK